MLAILSFGWLSYRSVFSTEMNRSSNEILTYEVISDLLADGHVEAAHTLSRLLVAAKKGNTLAMNDIVEVASSDWLSELRMATVAAENWHRKLDQLQTEWQNAAQPRSDKG